jgi:tRNA-modifying protein YgfZ
VIAGGDPALALKVLDGLLVMEDAEVESSSRAFCWVTGESAQEEMTRLGLSGHPSAVFAQPAFLVGMEPGALVELQATEDRLWWNPQQFEQLRIMSHVPRFGVDYDDHDNLHAAGLERKVVSWSKGCYLGQEVVCMQEMRGKVRRNVVALTLDQPVTEQLPLALKNSAGEVVGQCTSLFGTTALAKVTAPENQTGTRLDLASVDQVRLTSAVVVS